MKITYTGKAEALTPDENRKIEAKFAKLAKLLDAPKGEREAHVILAPERHLQRAEITVRYRDHELFGEAMAADPFSAITLACERMEKQILKVNTKWRDTKRAPIPESAAEAAAEEVPAGPSELEPEAAEGPQVFRVDHHDRRKPMTLDEAMLEIDDRAYVVYRDAATGRVSVLIKRRDGNFDLIEA
jgi:putative sigma-54 modulation protein